MAMRDNRIQQPTEYWLKMQTFFLSIWGCWPRGRYNIYYAYTACFVVIYANHFYSSLYGICQVFGDLEKVLTFANNSSITMPSSLIFVTVLTHRGNIRSLCEAVNAFYDQPEVAQHLHLLERTRRIMRNLTIGTLTMGVLDSLMWSLNERSVTSVFVYVNKTNLLPFDRYLPYEPSESALGYYTALFLFSFEFTLSVCTFLSTDMTSLALLAYGSTQLEILLRCLAYLRQDSVEYLRTAQPRVVRPTPSQDISKRQRGEYLCSETPSVETRGQKTLSAKDYGSNIISKEAHKEAASMNDIPEAEIVAEMKRRLAILVEVHRSILRYINDIENMIGMLLIVVFFAFTFIICLSLFQGTTRDMSFQQTYKFASACIHATIEVFIYCRLGESITSKSDAVGTTLYMSDWYDEPADIKTAYLIIMSRSDRPVIVRAKPFYVVNMATFVSVLNAAYTYFNLMREFNK